MISIAEIVLIAGPMVTAVFIFRAARLDWRTGEKSEAASAKHAGAFVALLMVFVTVFATWWQNISRQNAELKLERAMRQEVLGTPLRPEIYLKTVTPAFGRSVLVVSNSDPKLPLYDVTIRLPVATNYVRRDNDFDKPYPDLNFGTIPPGKMVSQRLLFVPHSVDIIQVVALSTRTAAYTEGFHIVNLTKDLEITPVRLIERNDVLEWGDPLKQ